MADQSTQAFINNVFSSLPANTLAKYGVSDPSQLGVKTTQVSDPETGSTYGAPQFYNTQTGADVGGAYGFLPGKGSYLVTTDTGDTAFRDPTKLGDGGFFSGLTDLLGSPVGGLLLGATGLPGLVGGAVAPGASAALQAGLGGAAIGGTRAALTGQDMLKGTLLGGAMGYGLGSLNAPSANAQAWDAATSGDWGGETSLSSPDAQAWDAATSGDWGGETSLSSPDAQAWDAATAPTVNPWDVATSGEYGGPTINAPTVPSLDNLPEATYSNEGRNYPTVESTQGPGGSPVNASVINNLPLTQVNPTDLSGLGTAAKLALAAAGATSVKSLLDQPGSYTMGTTNDGFNPVGGYTFNPSLYQANTPNPADFRPTVGVTTVTDAIKQAAARQAAQAPTGMAGGGQAQSNKPKYTGKAALSAMSPWERAGAQLNNAAYFARMPVGVGAAPQANVSQLGQFAQGGGISDLGSFSDGGRMLKGGGDGMSDSIPATIGGKRPARLADGEFVVPADVVSGLGNGSTDAGAKQLYKMMDRVRQSRTGTKKQGKEINALKQMPA